jgi:NADH dehydrogenase
MTTVSVFGGTGFLGQRLVRRLASEGTAVRIAVRHPDQARSTLPVASPERVTVFCADVRDRAAVARAVAGADAVVNAVSAYVETRDVSFEAVHEQGAQTLAREATAAGVARFVLVSGIGADPESGSAYIRSGGRGERAVQEAFPRRPSFAPAPCPVWRASSRSPDSLGCSGTPADRSR